MWDVNEKNLENLMDQVRQQVLTTRVSEITELHQRVELTKKPAEFIDKRLQTRNDYFDSFEVRDSSDEDAQLKVNTQNPDNISNYRKMKKIKKVVKSGSGIIENVPKKKKKQSKPSKIKHGISKNTQNKDRKNDVLKENTGTTNKMNDGSTPNIPRNGVEITTGVIETDKESKKRGKPPKNLPRINDGNPENSQNNDKKTDLLNVKNLSVENGGTTTETDDGTTLNIPKIVVGNPIAVTENGSEKKKRGKPPKNLPTFNDGKPENTQNNDKKTDLLNVKNLSEENGGTTNKTDDGTTLNIPKIVFGNPIAVTENGSEKKKRGRPRKHALKLSDGIQKKKRRGRPPKYIMKPNQENVSNNFSENNIGENSHSTKRIFAENSTKIPEDNTKLKKSSKKLQSNYNSNGGKFAEEEFVERAPLTRPRGGMMTGLRGVRPRMPTGPNQAPFRPSGMPIKRTPTVNLDNIKQEQNVTPSKKKRFDVLTPDKDDEDCQVICMQPKNVDGFPQIESVQGATGEPPENSIMHLSDSITLSVRNPPPKPLSPKKSDAKAVANILATRGITVTPTPKPKEKPDSPMKNSSSPLNLNGAVTIIPSAAQKAKKSQESDLPTVDLTDDVASQKMGGVGSTPASSPQKNSNLLPYRCYLCPAQYPNALGLSRHQQTYHKTTGPTNDMGIPLVNLKQPGVLQKLGQLGIFNFIPLPTSQPDGTFALPIINSRNPGNVHALGASNMLVLGPVKSIPKPNNARPQGAQQK